jgi:hypothetical protein
VTSVKRSSGFGRGGLVRDVDEALLVRRYAEFKWSVKRCAKAAHIDSKRAKRILEEHGVKAKAG